MSSWYFLHNPITMELKERGVKPSKLQFEPRLMYYVLTVISIRMRIVWRVLNHVNVLCTKSLVQIGLLLIQFHSYQYCCCYCDDGLICGWCWMRIWRLGRLFVQRARPHLFLRRQNYYCYYYVGDGCKQQLLKVPADENVLPAVTRMLTQIVDMKKNIFVHAIKQGWNYSATYWAYLRGEGVASCRGDPAVHDVADKVSRRGRLLRRRIGRRWRGWGSQEAGGGLNVVRRLWRRWAVPWRLRRQPLWRAEPGDGSPGDVGRGRRHLSLATAPTTTSLPSPCPAAATGRGGLRGLGRQAGKLGGPAGGGGRH